MFRGRFSHTIDTKGRVSIPATFRTELHRTSDHAPIVTNADGCLQLHPYEDWCKFEQELMTISSMDPDVQAYSRLMISGAQECAIDGQGRLLIPPYLREHAALGREVTLAGVGNLIEIWDKTRFDDALSRTQANFNEIASRIARMGK